MAPGALTLDPALPQLELALDAEQMAALLEHYYGEDVDVRDIEVVRHKPGRRCTVRYELELGRGRHSEGVYAKFFASGRAGRVYRSLAALAAATARSPSVEVPKPVGHNGALRAVLQREVAGTPARDALIRGDRALAERLAEALHALHSCAAELEPHHSLGDELRPLAERVQRLSVAAPALAPLARTCLALAQSAARRSRRWRRRPLHRDLYHDQVLVDGERLAFIDLDDAAMGEPAVDVANFLAHLRLLTLEEPASAPVLGVVARAFLRRYRELDRELDGELVTLLRGTTLLRLASIHLARAGEALAAALLEDSERALRSSRGVEVS
jgi:Ser/Thr protein kinase RdoA (MazF antagonist)